MDAEPYSYILRRSFKKEACYCSWFIVIVTRNLDKVTLVIIVRLYMYSLITK